MTQLWPGKGQEMSLLVKGKSAGNFCCSRWDTVFSLLDISESGREDQTSEMKLAHTAEPDEHTLRGRGESLGWLAGAWSCLSSACLVT